MADFNTTLFRNAKKKNVSCSEWMRKNRSIYHPTKVLLGNWIEDRRASPTCIWPKNDGKLKFSSTSEYGTEYKELGHSTSEVACNRWDIRMKGEGIALATLLGRKTEYLKNMASSYDLHYRYCVQEKTEPRQRTFNNVFLRWEPEIDYTKPYGNVTQFGLQKYKCYEWQKEKNSDHIPRSTYQAAYIAFPHQAMTVDRKGIPKEFSSKLCEVNTANKDMTYRGKPLHVIPNILPKGPDH